VIDLRDPVILVQHLYACHLNRALSCDRRRNATVKMKYLLLFLAYFAINGIVDASKDHKEPKRLRKICGSDGEVYDNREAFMKQVCEVDKALEYRKWDFCHVTRPKKKEVKKRQKRRRERALCGSDNVTYQTMRDFNEVRCNEQDLKIAFRGECSVCTMENLCPKKARLLKKKEKREKRRKKGKKVKKERRFKNRKIGKGIVCGSNGWAYQDSCEFLIDKCKKLGEGESLKLVKRKYGKACPRPESAAKIAEKAT